MSRQVYYYIDIDTKGRFIGFCIYRVMMCDDNQLLNECVTLFQSF